MKNVFFLLTLVLYLFGFTQELQTPRCIFDSLIQDAYTSEDFRFKMYHEEQEIQEILKNKSLLSENATIPVVIHIVKNPNICGNISHIVYASSSSVYGLNKIPFTETDSLNNTNSPYALSKKVMEEYAALYYRLYGIKSIAKCLSTSISVSGISSLAR